MLRMHGILGWGLSIATVFGLGAIAVRAERADDTPRYVRFERFIVPVVADGDVRGLIGLRIELEVADGQIDRIRPHLADAYRSALSQEASLHIDPRRPLNVARLHQLLNRATQSVMGKGASVRLYITDAAVRPVHGAVRT